MSSGDTSDSSEYEPETLSAVQFQSGRIYFGDHNNEEESIRVDIEFDFPFYETPVIVCSGQCEDGQNYPDCFSCTVINPHERGCQVNIGRVNKETNGWGQQGVLNWFALCRKESELIQCGIAECGDNNDEDETKVVKVHFKPAFPKGVKPVIAATVLGEDYPDAFCCCLRRVTRKNAEIVVGRSWPVYKGWAQNAKVNWVATNCFPSLCVDVGNFDEGEGNEKTGNFEFPCKFKKKPTVFVTPQHEKGSSYPDCMGACVAAVEKDGLQLNMARVHEDLAGWGQQMRCHMICIP